jgi:hypothetical protein
MQLPSTQNLLAAWERGRDASQRTERALALLGALYGEASRKSLSQLSIGERDSLLLAMRQQTFGSQLAAVTACPGCGARLEMKFATADVCVARGQSPPKNCLTELFSLRTEGYEVTFRLPNSLDLAAVQHSGCLDQKRKLLLEQVVSRALRGTEEISPGELPEGVVDGLEQRMSEADPQAEVWLNLACAACGRSWQALFDVVPFFWSELDAWAIRLLREVHCLARAYAWREADILAMSPWRRQCYLEMLAG